VEVEQMTVKGKRCSDGCAGTWNIASPKARRRGNQRQRANHRAPRILEILGCASNGSIYIFRIGNFCPSVEDFDIHCKKKIGLTLVSI
jgi:hypothetical protein